MCVTIQSSVEEKSTKDRFFKKTLKKSAQPVFERENPRVLSLASRCYRQSSNAQTSRDVAAVVRRRPTKKEQVPHEVSAQSSFSTRSCCFVRSAVLGKLRFRSWSVVGVTRIEHRAIDEERERESKIEIRPGRCRERRPACLLLCMRSPANRTERCVRATQRDRQKHVRMYGAVRNVLRTVTDKMAVCLVRW